MHSSEEYNMNNDWREYYDPQYVIMHHGIKGQKWGIRRFQNEDGTLTPAGKKKYGDKVTMHKGKQTIFVGGRAYQSHKEYKTANKFAKATFEKRKAEIKEEKKNSNEGFIQKNVTAFNKNVDNRNQYNYELARNRHNAGVAEFKRGVATEAAKSGAKTAAKIGASILAGYLVVNTINAVNDRASGVPSKNKNALATIGTNKLDSHYEYSVGKAQVAKALTKAVVFGAIAGAANEISKEHKAEQIIRETNISERKRGVENTRAKRALEDEKRWKKGQV